ncbi:MAG: hypothetical protein KAI43_12420, partial [Candidatus Aureabacteria bacterium]|nr:hypothetical protein [Candidatus Auribacterota bacterium]
MKITKIIIFTIPLITYFSICSYPDLLRLKNGQNVEGKIQNVTDKTVTLKVKYGDVNYSFNDIEE